jgi:enterochelin esterase family protein
MTAATLSCLYLVGGSGDLPSNWVYDGRVNFMMDNLLAEGKAVPMVIAIPNNQVVHRSNPRHTELTFKLFEAELRQHVIPLVEREYSVRNDPKVARLSDYPTAAICWFHPGSVRFFEFRR